LHQKASSLDTRYFKLGQIIEFLGVLVDLGLNVVVHERKLVNSFVIALLLGVVDCQYLHEVVSGVEA
jgi:hypothetical protein